MKLIAVSNKSKMVSRNECRAMCAATQYQVFSHLAPAWSVEPVPVTFFEDEAEIPEAEKGEIAVVRLVDDTYEKGALGWHTEEMGGRIYSEVAAGPSFDAGSFSLAGPYAVSSTFSHEVLETLLDPDINLWVQDGNAKSWAREICDPCEAQSYLVGVQIDGEHYDVLVSDFVLPSWFDASAIGPTTFLGHLTGPFQLAMGGYAVMGDSPQSAAQVFDEDMPSWRRDQKIKEASRAARRIKKVRP